MLGALVLAPVLLLADIWHSPQLRVVHRHPLAAAVGGVVALGAARRGALLDRRRRRCSRRWRWSRFRSGSRSRPAARRRTCSCRCTSSSRAGLAGVHLPALRDAPSAAPRRAPSGRAGWIERLLALVRRPLRAAGGLLAGLREGAPADGLLLRPVRAAVLPAARSSTGRRGWSAAACGLVVALAVRVRAARVRRVRDQDDVLNPKLVAANDVHAYFTVNSVFFDPDIFGRFLALVMIVARRRAALRPASAASSWARSRCSRSCGRARADALALEPRRAAGRARGARGAALASRRPC